MKFLDDTGILKITTTKKVQASISFLESRRAELQKYDSLENFVHALISEEPKTSVLSGLEFHLAVVRNEVLRELRRNGVFVGQSIIEELAFYVFREGKDSNPFQSVFGWIRKSGLHHPGLLIFPLYGVGILGFGAFRALGHGDTTIEFVLKQVGMVFAPQTNSDKYTAELIHRAAKYLGITQRVSQESIEHHLRFPVMAWMTRNPLLFVRVRAVAGERFENQRFVTMKLRLCTSFLMFIHTLELGVRGPKAPSWSSSRAANSWATLDIKHYLFYQIGQKGRLEGMRVPITVDRVELAELSTLGIDFTPRIWKKRPRAVGKVKKAFDQLERAYLEEIVTSDKNTPLARATRKLYESLKYFRRSFRPSSESGEKYVNLAIAFETMLLDGGMTASRKGIVDRLRIALKRVPRGAELIRNVGRVYRARNDVVHSGFVATSVDLRLAQKAFVECFLWLCLRLDKLRTIKQTSAVIAELLRP
jgi:hypothetical protein